MIQKTWIERVYDLVYDKADQSDTTMQDELDRLVADIASKIEVSSVEIKSWISDHDNEIPAPYRKQMDQVLEETEKALGLPQKFRLQREVDAHFTGGHLPEGQVDFEGLADGRLVGAMATYEDTTVLLLAPPRTQIVGASIVVQEQPSHDEIEEIARQIVNSVSWSQWSKIGAQT